MYSNAFEIILTQDLRNTSNINIISDEYQFVKGFLRLEQFSLCVDKFINTMVGLYRRSVLGFEFEIKHIVCAKLFKSIKSEYNLNERPFNIYL
jgi:hypothetical protein